MAPHEINTPPARYVEFGPHMPIELQKNISIVNQEPFISLLQILPEDFLKGDKQELLAGLGTFVRALAMEPGGWVKCMSVAPINRCKNYITPKYWTTSIDVHRSNCIRFLDDFPYWKQYLQEIWITQKDTFDTTGFPKVNPKSSRNEPYNAITFAAYQAYRREDPYFIPPEDLPRLETPSSLTAKLSRMRQTGLNKKFRVIKAQS